MKNMSINESESAHLVLTLPVLSHSTSEAFFPSCGMQRFLRLKILVSIEFYWIMMSSPVVQLKFQGFQCRGSLHGGTVYCKPH
jgi:hypothetical protein